MKHAKRRLRRNTRYWHCHRYRSEEQAAGECFEKAVRSRAPKWVQQERAGLTLQAGWFWRLPRCDRF
jgi:hypothetical protein